MKKAYLRFGGTLPKTHTRHFPGIHRLGAAAYKSDAEIAAEKKATEEAAAKAPVTKAAILKEFTTIKDALEKNLNDKAEKQEKNLDEKIEAVNKSIEDLKKLPEAATAEELKALKSDIDVTIKAFDKLQTRMKSEGMRSNGSEPREDISLKGLIAKSFHGFKKNIEEGKIGKGDNEVKMILKAAGADMTVANNVSTGVVPNTYRDGIVPVPFELIHMRNLVAITPSETDSYHFYRHTIGNGVIGFQGGENNPKNEFDEDLVEQTVNLDYLAGFLRISRKMLRNFTALQAYITRWLPEKYYQAEDTKAYQSLVSQATGVGDISTGGGEIKQIIKTIGLQKKAKYNVNGIVVDGSTWADILTFTASGSGEYTMPFGVVTISPSGMLMICGIPVYTASWIAADTALIGDWRFFEIIQSEALSLQFFEQDGTNVQQNKITARIEASVGFALLDPKAFVNLSLASVS